MRIPKWLALSILTLVLWGSLGVLGKALGDSMSPAQCQAFSTLGLLPLLGALVPGRRRMKEERARGGKIGRGMALAFCAGLLAGLGNIAYYKAMAAGGAASTVTPLVALYPLVTVVLAVAFLREKLSLIQGAGIVLALGAIYLFNPADAGIRPSRLVTALLPVGLWGLSAFLQKLSANHVSSRLSTFAFLCSALAIAAATVATQPIQWQLPARVWVEVLALGALFGLGNLTLLAAYGSGGKASVVTPLAGLYSVVTIPLAMALLGERPGLREALGIALAFLAVIALSRERTPAPAEEATRDPAPPLEAAAPRSGP
jgi:transporter family protein